MQIRSRPACSPNRKYDALLVTNQFLVMTMQNVGVLPELHQYVVIILYDIRHHLPEMQQYQEITSGRILELEGGCQNFSRPNMTILRHQ